MFKGGLQSKAAFIQHHFVRFTIKGRWQSSLKGRHIIDYWKKERRTIRISENINYTNDDVMKYVIEALQSKLPRALLSFDPALWGAILLSILCGLCGNQNQPFNLLPLLSGSALIVLWKIPETCDYRIRPPVAWERSIQRCCAALISIGALFWLVWLVYS